MREILFRGKSIHDNKWLEGSFLKATGLRGFRTICQRSREMGMKCHFEGGAK